MGAHSVVVVGRETFRDCMADIRRLFAEHEREVNPYPDIPGALDEATYLAGEAVDALRIFTARIDGILIGYAAFIVQNALNWPTCKQATQVLFYVEQSKRHAHGLTTAGLRLIRVSEAALADEGVQMILQPQFIKHPDLGRLLDHEGYEQESIVWAKRIGRT